MTGVRDGRVERAYDECEALTREQAANFYYGIRLLSRERRRAMCAAYAFSRQVDDIGDGDLGAPEKLARLAERERALEAVAEGAASAAAGELGGDGVIVALADACERFPIPVSAFAELVEGVRMDVHGVEYEQFDELVLYCRRVAGTIGRICLAIFALRTTAAEGAASEAASLADDLGVALQLTNILRDVREDAENGRVYLPREDLRRFGLLAGDDDLGSRESQQALAGELTRSLVTVDPQSVEGLVRFEASRAREWFTRGGQLAPLLDRRSAACLLAMAGIYRRLLDRIEAQPVEAMRGRTSLPAREKAWVAVRGMLGAGL
ncbi:MAG TPA: squalene/phytoene synthase family protein [Solirubrobacteraceae bacterium]|jgi:phytoene synthase